MMVVLMVITLVLVGDGGGADGVVLVGDDGGGDGVVLVGDDGGGDGDDSCA